MVKKKFCVSLDVKNSSSNRPIEVVEGDNGNEIEVTLTDEGAPVDLTGCRVLAVFSKSDGRTAQEDNDGHGINMDAEDVSKFTIALYTGSFSPGLVECEIQVLSGEAFSTLVTSAKFNFSCRRSIMNVDTVKATDEYPILVDLIDRVMEAEQELSEIAADEGARRIAEISRVSAEEQRIAAEEERTFSEEGRKALALKWQNPSAEADTLAANAEASAAVTLDMDGIVFNFGIPKGEKGDPGDNSQPHASQHAANGSDPVTPASIGALPISYVNAPADFNDLTTPGIHVCIDSDNFLNRPWGGYHPTTVIVSWSETAESGSQLAYDSFGSIAVRPFYLQNGAYVFDYDWEYNLTPYDLGNMAKKSVSKTATLAADGWTGTEAPYTQTVNISGMTASANAFFDIAMTATADEVDAATAGILRATAQGAGTLTVTAFGDMPAIDIPVSVLIVG